MGNDKRKKEKKGKKGEKKEGDRNGERKNKIG